MTAPVQNIDIRLAALGDMTRVREMFLEYQQWLGVDLCFQGFAEELASLPGRYAAPKGAIYLATEKDQIVGCVALRPRGRREAELKRLYVRSQHRGQGAGRLLFYSAMEKARQIGYASMVLDTLPSMRTAKSLYLAYGFKEIPAYYPNPEPGAEYYRYVFE